jgi:hypothetical protein
MSDAATKHVPTLVGSEIAPVVYFEGCAGSGLPATSYRCS